MSTTNAEDSNNPEPPNLTPAEIDDLKRLEVVAQHGLGSFVQVGNALTEIRDRRLYRASHPSFETYVSERWGVNFSSGDSLPQTSMDADARSTPTAQGEPLAAPRSKPCEALARACEETLSALEGGNRLGIEIRLAVRNYADPSAPVVEQSVDPGEVDDPVGIELLPTLRWLLTQATGTLGEVSHELESRAADIDDSARRQLRDDVLVLDGELAIVKALLVELHDWDSELTRLLKDDLPPFDTDPDPDDDE